jgi:uncharacterized protein YndB with AHSA1/START domain
MDVQLFFQGINRFFIIHNYLGPMDGKKITVQAIVNADKAKVWEYWTDPKHIVRWNAASDDWECPAARNDLTEGGRFVSTMAAKDGSSSFDFGGTYTKVEEGKRIEYVIDDGRKVSVSFEEVGGGILVTEAFEPENMHAEELQRAGWQAILDNFRRYAESVRA